MSVFLKNLKLRSVILETILPVFNTGWNFLDQEPNTFLLSNSDKTATCKDIPPIGDGAIRGKQSASAGDRYFEVAIVGRSGTAPFVGAGTNSTPLSGIPGIAYVGGHFAFQRGNAQWGNSGGFGPGGTISYPTDCVVGIRVDFNYPAWYVYVDGFMSGFGYELPASPPAMYPMISRDGQAAASFTLRVLASELEYLPVGVSPWID